MRQSTQIKNSPLFSFPKEFYARNATTFEDAKGEMYVGKVSTMVSLNFQGNSMLLSGFYEAIENKLIK
jgi:hypothetical protein